MRLYSAVPILKWFSFNILGLIWTANAANPSPSDLKQVHILYRHGDRAPIHPYEKDAHSDESFWPYGYEHLTKEGMMQQHRLGQLIRNRYGSLLSSHWNASEIKVVTTDVDRTINSAQANVQGLYSPVVKDRRFFSHLDWNPVPIRPIPAEQDDLLNVENTCPRVEKEEEEVYQLPHVLNVTRQYSDVFEVVNEKLSLNLTTIKELGKVYDYYFIQRVHNITLPKWMVPLMDRLKVLQDIEFSLFAYSDILRLLRGGPLLKKVLGDMDVKVSNKSGPNVLYYSAHDTTVAVALSTLQVFNNISPPYAAALFYELYDPPQDSAYVRILYRNVTDSTDVHVLTIPGCKEHCPLTQVRELLADYIPTDYKELCNPDGIFNRKYVFSMVVVTGALVVMLSLFTLGVALLLLVRRRASQRDRAYALLAEE